MIAVLGLLVVVVGVLSWASARSTRRARGCCAPADPRDDLRMRAAFEDSPQTPERAPD